MNLRAQATQAALLKQSKLETQIKDGSTYWQDLQAKLTEAKGRLEAAAHEQSTIEFKTAELQAELGKLDGVVQERRRVCEEKNKAVDEQLTLLDKAREANQACPPNHLHP